MLLNTVLVCTHDKAPTKAFSSNELITDHIKSVLLAHMQWKFGDKSWSSSHSSGTPGSDAPVCLLETSNVTESSMDTALGRANSEECREDEVTGVGSPWPRVKRKGGSEQKADGFQQKYPCIRT